MEQVGVKINGQETVSTAAKKAGHGLGGLDNKVKSVSKGISKNFGAISIAAGAAFLAFRQISRGVEDLIDTYKEQEQAEARLEQVIKSTGGAAGFTAQELKNYASELQSVTTFGDEAIISAQTILATFTKIGQESFPVATEAVLNMSEVLGQSLTSSAQQLGKALQDPVEGVTALRRVGVRLTQDQENQIKKFVELNDVASAQAVILGELETEFGGVARAVGQTATGSLEQFKNALGDAKEIGGQFLLEFIAPAVEGLTDFITKQNEANKSTKNLNDAITGKGGVDIEAALEAQKQKVEELKRVYDERNQEELKYYDQLTRQALEAQISQQGYTDSQQEVLDLEQFRLELLEAQLETQRQEANLAGVQAAEEAESARRAEQAAAKEAERKRIQDLYLDTLTQVRKELGIIDRQVLAGTIDKTDEWDKKNQVVISTINELIEQGFNPTAGYLQQFIDLYDIWIERQKELNSEYNAMGLAGGRAPTVAEVEAGRREEASAGGGGFSVPGFVGELGEVGQIVEAIANGGDATGVFLSALLSAASQVEELNQIMNAVSTTFGQLFEVIGPVLGRTLSPLVNYLLLFGNVIGQTILPVLEALAPVTVFLSTFLQQVYLPLLQIGLIPAITILTTVLEILTPLFNALAIALVVVTSPLRFVGDLLAWLGNWILFAGRAFSDWVYNLKNPLNPRDTAGSMPGAFSSNAFSGLGGLINQINAAFAGAAAGTATFTPVSEFAAPELTAGEFMPGSSTTIQRPPDIYITQNFNQPIVGAGGLAEVGEFVVQSIQDFAGIGGVVEFA